VDVMALPYLSNRWWVCQMVYGQKTTGVEIL